MAIGNSLPSIALSGMQAAQTQLQISAHNVANLATPGFKRQVVTQEARAEGGVSATRQHAGVEGSALEADVVAQLQAKNAFLANLAVFRTADKLAGALLDDKA